MKRSILLAGGRGSRMAPQSQAQNKHLMPVYTDYGVYPMIWYPLNTLIKSGSTDILIISSQEHAGDIIDFLGDGHRFGVSLTYKIQDHNDSNRPVGIASALKLAEDFVGHESSFAVILGDNFYEDTFKQEFEEFHQYCKSKTYSSNPVDHTCGHIFLKKVPDPSRFGVATLVDDKVTKIVEKPIVPESDYAVTGLYLFNSFVFTALPRLKVSARGELEISDINDEIVKYGTMKATIMEGYWSDMGIPSSMLRTQEFINSSGFKLDLK